MKRTRLNRVSKKNSHKERDDSLVVQYKSDNPDCEFGKTFPGNFPRLPACDAHHLFGGRSGRNDLLSNLISLSREAHDWCHANPTAGRVLAIYVKFCKNEMCQAEFRQASGMRIQGWLAKTVVSDWIEPYYKKLLKAYP